MIELAAIFIASLIVIVLTYRIGKFAGRTEGIALALAVLPTEEQEQERRIREQRESAPWQ